MKNIMIILFLSVLLFKNMNAQEILWKKNFGLNTADDIGRSVVETTDGGIAIIGNTGSFSGSNDVWLIKTNAGGDTLWTRTYGEIGDDLAYEVEQTVDGGFILVGATESFGSNGMVGGFSGSIGNQLYFNNGVINWNQVGQSTLNGIGGGLAGGLTGQYISSDPILPGIVGGFVGGGIEGSYSGNTWNGAFQGAWWGGFGGVLTVKAYKIYGEYLEANYTPEMQSKYEIGRCKGFCDALTESGVDLPNAEFGNFNDPVHVGKVLGGDIYGNHYILSKEGAGPISVLTGRQLSIGSGTATKPGMYLNPYTQTNQYWSGYGNYRIISSPNYYWRRT